MRLFKDRLSITFRNDWKSTYLHGFGWFDIAGCYIDHEGTVYTDVHIALIGFSFTVTWWWDRTKNL